MITGLGAGNLFIKDASQNAIDISGFEDGWNLVMDQASSEFSNRVELPTALGDINANGQIDPLETKLDSIQNDLFKNNDAFKLSKALKDGNTSALSADMQFVYSCLKKDGSGQISVDPDKLAALSDDDKTRLESTVGTMTDQYLAGSNRLLDSNIDLVTLVGARDQKTIGYVKAMLKTAGQTGSLLQGLSSLTGSKAGQVNNTVSALGQYIPNRVNQQMRSMNDDLSMRLSAGFSMGNLDKTSAENAALAEEREKASQILTARSKEPEKEPNKKE
ncbi:MAG: hypothetical protein WC838_04000 [Candidatus Margulisiibacteriota bacterium]|jgi:hypothetical protein